MTAQDLAKWPPPALGVDATLNPQGLDIEFLIGINQEFNRIINPPPYLGACK